MQVWKSEHERPYFYAGASKGAEVAAWKQAARAELAHCSNYMSHANAMLDMVKAFERVPGDLVEDVLRGWCLYVVRASVVVGVLCC